MNKELLRIIYLTKYLKYAIVLCQLQELIRTLHQRSSTRGRYRLEKQMNDQIDFIIAMAGVIALASALGIALITLTTLAFSSFMKQKCPSCNSRFTTKREHKSMCFSNWNEVHHIEEITHCYRCGSDDVKVL